MKYQIFWCIKTWKSKRQNFQMIFTKHFLFFGNPSQDQMVILQDLPRFLQKMVILHNLATKWLSCKILQDDGHLARSCKKNGYLVKFLQVRSGRVLLSLVVLDALFFIQRKLLPKYSGMSFQRSIETKFNIWNKSDICILLQPLVLILVTLIYLH